jgi:hypothetical protein
MRVVRTFACWWNLIIFPMPKNIPKSLVVKAPTVNARDGWNVGLKVEPGCNPTGLFQFECKSSLASTMERDGRAEPLRTSDGTVESCVAWLTDHLFMHVVYHCAVLLLWTEEYHLGIGTNFDRVPRWPVEQVAAVNHFFCAV